MYDDSVGSAAVSRYSNADTKAVANTKATSGQREHIVNSGGCPTKEHTDACEDTCTGKVTSRESCRHDDG